MIVGNTKPGREHHAGPESGRTLPEHSTLVPNVVMDIPTIRGELFAKFQTGFCSDPTDAVFKALGVSYTPARP
jgi:hypothetical protein